MNKILEASFSILGMAGSLLVACVCSYGWILWVVSCLLAIAWGIRTKAGWFTAMQIFFLITNSIGIYNYFIK